MNQMDQFSAILVDDNPWILSLWQAEAKHRKTRIAVFDSASQFHQASDSFDRSIPLFIDYSIDANGIMTLNISQFARQVGFKNIFYATGHQPSDIKTDLVDGVVGKTPPVWLWKQDAKLLSSDERAFLAANMSADQKLVFHRRMNEIYDAEFNSEIALPAKVAQIWTDAVYRSLSEEDLRLQIESAWRLANESV